MAMNSTVLRRQIGRTFRRLRREADLTVQQAADRAEMGKSTISRIEEGADTVRFKDRDVEALLKVYNPSASEHDVVLAMTREARQSGKSGAWWQSYSTTALPRGFNLLMRLEASAETIIVYEAELIPGLIQTRGYTESLFLVRDDRPEYQQLIELRMDRQAIWQRDDPPRFEVVLSEAVLRRPIGGRAVMAEQLRHVLALSERSNMSIRLLPFSAGAYLGIGTTFTLLTFPDDMSTGDPIEPPLLHIDTFNGGLVLNDEADIAAHRAVWKDVSHRALGIAASRQLITKAMKEYEDA